MNFPDSNEELNQLFVKGKLPTTDVFNGDQYYVDILTGLPSFRKLNHRKIFYQKENAFYGNNQILRCINFGYFQVEEGQDQEMNVPVCVLNYAQPQTSWILNRMRDHIVEIEYKSIYLGRYYFKKEDSLIFKGYFSLQNCSQK